MSKQNASKFQSEVVEENILQMYEDALEFMRKNLEPQDIFPDNELRAWAKDNGFVEVSDA